MGILAGVGASTHVDSATAGGSAVREALDNLAVPARLLVVFTTEHYDHALVLDAIHAAARATPLLGCCTGGLITPAGILPVGVGVLALGGDEFEVALAIAPGLSTTPTASAEAVAETLEAAHLDPEGERNNVALVFADGLTGSLAMDTAIQSAAAVLGPLCPLFGGAAGDSLNYGHTVLFAGDRIMSDAFVAAQISTSAPIGVGVHHGWRPASRRMAVTRSTGNLLYELDGRPAIAIYRELLPEETITEANFREISRFHPLGFVQAGSEPLVRLPLAVTDEGALSCVGTLPGDAFAYIMQGDPASLIEAAAYAAERAMVALEGNPPAVAIIINCVTRPPLLGEQRHTELERIRAVIGANTPFLGMYSFGEIAAADGPPAFHNKTVAVCVLGRGDG
ncbi:MAG: hypothetical protein EI684_12985 [Candidatus Viridilinea halotolerans]|uniref:Histidine kinase n=1 Tax=Candidatus Viridilinea halotolerans TaxID=2491704 RepID=A0A426TXW0_9CHLR|nr:MAG: hypothetical protein EI684_12985 [Candidatus Viridilinea halotolerans]